MSQTTIVPLGPSGPMKTPWLVHKFSKTRCTPQPAGSAVAACVLAAYTLWQSSGRSPPRTIAMPCTQHTGALHRAPCLRPSLGSIRLAYANLAIHAAAPAADAAHTTL
ncbi:hypothetical protein GGX14DRAFT_559119 [Mycena pura]|uniref:Uncharacterized protein n=1 Tax=Mycena pura TaxID=153505 RepID=A0AAD6YJC4_9AGAR|nr:hypothetical protein GGX14DRAFT_559119 [Mycena pura]